MKPIRVLIVDDSPTVQAALKRILSEASDIEVVGSAADAFEAKNLIIEKEPDFITLDIEMPRMDGITFLKRLMSFRPLPVIMISSYTRENSRRTLQALEAGAVDFVAKPADDVRFGLQRLKEEIIFKVRTAARAKISPSVVFDKPKRPKTLERPVASRKIIAVAASTGGTVAIRRLLGAFPAGMNGMVIVQHMPARFTKAFAEQLDALFPMDIKEAEDGDRIDRGKVLIAPGGRHLEVAADQHGYYIRLQDGHPVKHQRPSADVLFQSVAESAGRDAIGIVLTGMGSDGTDGLLAMKNAGALTVAQDETSSVVFGMPGSAIERGAIEIVAPLDEIGDIILSTLKN
jgi:two-component system chemotaxis response regulator CheB